MHNKVVVITSVNGVTEAVRRFAEVDGWHVVLVGDRKSPPLDKHPHPNITYLSVEYQKKLGFRLCAHCPFDHYSRKNIGYIYAMKNAAEFIADADDDNVPYENWGKVVAYEPWSMPVVTSPKLVNIYRLFTDEFIWPRGFPLAAVRDRTAVQSSQSLRQEVGIWQGLADVDPDVDAIYRLVIAGTIRFEQRGPVALEEGVYCPFNSQNTIWTRKAFPYLYLPAFVKFRFTDILRGYVAQRGIWPMGLRLAFTSATVFQSRNAHNLISDFVDEIPCYTQTEGLIDLLDKAALSGNPDDDLHTLYEMLFRNGIVNAEELEVVNAWLCDIDQLC